MKTTRLFLALGLLLSLLGLPAGAQRFSFAAFGDTPYFDFEIPMLTRMLAEMNQRPLAFVLHVGDIKSGSDRCDDVLYENRAAWFGISRHPFVALPGDNDWTDCIRASNGAYAPLERLDVFRRIFHAGEFGARLGPLNATRQSEQTDFAPYVENLRWVRDEVLFLTLHVVGSHNNIERQEEHRQRDQANQSWVRESFAQARARGWRAAVVVMHANPMLEMAAGDGRRKGFAGITSALFDEVKAFDRPVLLIHGDTHHFRFEQPLRARGVPGTLRQLSRLEVHGSPSVEWTEVVVDTASENVFSIAPRRK